VNVEIGTEAAQFPEKEYINGIFVAVYTMDTLWQAEQGEQQPVSSMETKGSKCRKQLDQLCFRIKDKLEFAENGERSPLKR
jgi:hypothetical protein